MICYKSLFFCHNNNGESMYKKGMFYKTQNFIYMDDKDKRNIDVFNDYGYNLDTCKRTVFDEDNFVSKPKTFINKDFLNIKR